MTGLRKRLRSESAQGVVLISPTLVFTLLMLAVPLIMVLALSFWTQSYLTLDRSFSLENYKTAWTEPMYQYLMARSLKISIFVTALTVLLAYPVAYFISFHVTPKRKAMWIFLITIPFWTSYLMRIFLWKVILGYNGVVNGSLMGLGLIEQPLKPERSTVSLVPFSIPMVRVLPSKLEPEIF